MTTVFKQVGPYEILRQIGHGGMAVVFLALDTRVDRRVALKLVQQGSDREAQEIVEAEQFGAELQKRFSERGAHVPAVYEYGIDEDSGYFYVAMEYFDGENLSEVVSHGPLPPARATEIAIELARFLEEAHVFQAVVNGRNLQSLLHLDLKPRNVRITSTQQVKVLDFGTAKALSLSRKVTRNDFGSVAYLSPERLETGEVDARADLWALGVVLYEMLRGTPPFQAADTRRLERLILARRPPPSLTEQCPSGVAAIVSRLLDPRSVGALRERTRDTRGPRTVQGGTPDARRGTGLACPCLRRRGDEADVDGGVRCQSAVPGDADPDKTRRTQPPPLPSPATCRSVRSAAADSGAAAAASQESSTEPIQPFVSGRAAAGWPWPHAQRGLGGDGGGPAGERRVRARVRSAAGCLERLRPPGESQQLWASVPSCAPGRPGRPDHRRSRTAWSRTTSVRHRPSARHSGLRPETHCRARSRGQATSAR